MFTLPDPNQFNFKDCVIAGDECVLVTPKDMGVEWNEQNKYFRSSIWRKSDMHPVSLGYRKFTNYGEKPQFEPLKEVNHLEVITKIDGSCLIVSKYKDELIIRTRGTIDASKLENGQEIELLLKKYPKAFDNNWLKYGNFSLLFEWTTPTNRIVLEETKEPTLWLTGIVSHRDYAYLTQTELDLIAKTLEVKRPLSFGITIDGDIERIKKTIEPLRDIEGVVVYTNRGQTLKKIKTLRYLELHRVFTGIKSVDHLFDLFVEYGCPDRENFEALIATNFDWELVTTLHDLTSELYVKWQRIKDRVNIMHGVCHGSDWMKSFSRKEQAEQILKLFPKDSGIAFAVLDEKEIPPHKLWKTYVTNSYS